MTMTSRLRRWACSSVVTLSGGLLPLASVAAYDYPTLDRVRFVQECMAENPGPEYEMTSKCVCLVDALAQELSTEELSNLQTATKANSIGGERGGYIRDTELLQADIKRYREMLARLKKGCFITTGGR